MIGGRVQRNVKKTKRGTWGLVLAQTRGSFFSILTIPQGVSLDEGGGQRRGGARPPSFSNGGGKMLGIQGGGGGKKNSTSFGDLRRRLPKKRGSRSTIPIYAVGGKNKARSPEQFAEGSFDGHRGGNTNMVGGVGLRK